MTGEKMGCRDPRGFRDLMLAVAGVEKPATKLRWRVGSKVAKR